MQPTILDSQAKEALRKAVRNLRAHLIEQIQEAAKGEYRLHVTLEKAQLPEARRCRRERLEAWLAEQVRSAPEPKAAKDTKDTRGKGAEDDLRNRSLLNAVKEAAHTLVNRLVLLRILEHHEVLKPAVVTGGWSSPAYAQEYAHYAGALMGDATRGYQALLEVVFAELSLELPGLFGPVGLTALFPVPAATLREVVDALNDPALERAWGDDTTLGWVYQYWNDPEREALDAKISRGGKIEPHEIAAKTQMFTERYIVEWLLQNSLGLMWLSICKKHEKDGWKPEAESVLPVLDARRAEFRARREKGEVPLDALMPVEPGLESAWKYYVSQPIPADAADNAPDSIRDLRLLDPACGSGHFLVIAFDLLARMYQEEAKHRGASWPAVEIAESILANNLHGIDIDPRAIQIAAAGLWLKAKLAAPDAELQRMNLVAPSFRLASLPQDDPALETLYRALEEELMVPRALTLKLVESLSGVDHLGTLLRIDQVITGWVEEVEQAQGPLFTHVVKREPMALESRVAKFLDEHAAEADLGLRLEGEQLAAGLRFVGLVKEGTYDVVVGNPPYQGLSRTAQFEYVTTNYERAKADLYAAFLERGMELVREGGVSALLTMRGWMFLGQFKELREHLLSTYDLRGLVDLDSGAFDEVSAAQVVLSVACSVFLRGAPDSSSIALRPTPTEDRASSRMTDRKRAGLLAQVGRYEFDTKRFEVIEGEPIVYWWTKEFLERYAKAPKLGDVSPVRQGAATSDNTRFLRRPWEVAPASWNGSACSENEWVAYTKGAAGKMWIDPVNDILTWRRFGLEIKAYAQHLYGSYTRTIKNEGFYFRAGVAFSPIGNVFSARVTRTHGVFGHMGSSVFADDIPHTLCVMNSVTAQFVLGSLNPGVHFEVGDVNRLPIFAMDSSSAIFAKVEDAFGKHESHRESSVEFKSPGPSLWRSAQAWAQRAVNRPEGSPLPPYAPEYDPPDAKALVSFAIGVALGRFGANGEGILDTAPSDALPTGILFIGPSEHYPDSLKHPAVAPLLAAWDEHQYAILAGKKQSLRDWLRKDFFAHHKNLYENRPIYFPVSSEKRSFVAWISIHRWADNTLQILLADHLHRTLQQLDGEIKDLNEVRASSDKKTAAAAEKQYAPLKKLREELSLFIEAVSQCAERGAPPTDLACPLRTTDAPFRMDLDDGVLINSAALWPLLTPQWNDPKRWWKQLCLADGKDYDWAHLTRQYFPDRVEGKCKVDPSLAVAHGSFWKYHPAKAYAWELRLQDEIRPEFTIDEADSDALRKRFLAENVALARELQAAETKRRKRKAAKSEAEEAADLESSQPDDSETD